MGWTLFIASTINIGISYLPLPLADFLSQTAEFEIAGMKVFRDYMIEGIFCIVLGYVFKEGNRIYEEQKLTV